MIDTHAHLNFKDFNGDRDEVISRAFQSGIRKIINVGTDLKESRASVKLAGKYKNIFATIGLHPCVFSGQETTSGGQLGELRKLAGNKKVVAIGEIGLDYYHVASGMKPGAREIEKIRKIQMEGFNKQLELAKELNLPVIIHCRASEENPKDVYEDCYQILTQQHLLSTLLSKRGRGNEIVMHCYGGDMEFTKKLLKHKNIYFSFTGNITYKTKKEIQGTERDLAEIIKIIPPERIMLETDCPFLAPQKFRGKRNEPAYMKYVAEKLAEIKGVSFEKLGEITAKNAKKFFKI